MIRWLLIASAAIFAGLLASQWLIDDPGVVYIERGDTGVSLSLAAAILIVVTAVLALYLAWQLLKLLLFPGRWARKSLLEGSKARARKRTDKGFIAYSAGNFKQARQQLLASVGNVDSPVINYLLAARCSQFMGEDDRALELLEQAQLADPEAHPAVSVVQAEIYQQQGDWEQSLATLKPLEESRNAMVVRALVKVYEELGDYESLYGLIVATEKQKVLSSQELDRLRTRILNCWIDQQVDRIQRGRSPEDGLNTLFSNLSKSDQSRVEIVQAYAEGLMTLGMSQSAEKVLRPLIKRDVEPSLLALYGRTDGADVYKQIKLLQSVTSEDRHAMMLALARQSKRAELWGQARDFYQKCFELSPSVEVAKPYAEVLRAMDEPEAAAEVERTAIAAFSR